MLFAFAFGRPGFCDDPWRAPVAYTLNRDRVSLAIPLSPDWSVTYPDPGTLSASNSRLRANLSVSMTAMAGKLEKIVGDMFGEGTCPSLKTRVYELGQAEIEETYCGALRGSADAELARFFMIGNDLVAIQCRVPAKNFPVFADTIWMVIRGIHVEGEDTRIALSKSDRLYASPDGSFELVYPRSWSVRPTGKTLLFFLPKGPSIQVIPATDALLGGNPEAMFDAFKRSLSYTLKGYTPLRTDAVAVNGRETPRFAYTYRLPDGTVEKAWAVLLAFPGKAMLFVCSAPLRDFEDAKPVFLATIRSFRVKR